MAETQLIPRLVVVYTELGGGRLKKRNGFLKLNFEPGLNWGQAAKSSREMVRLPTDWN